MFLQHVSVPSLVRVSFVTGPNSTGFSCRLVGMAYRVLPSLPPRLDAAGRSPIEIRQRDASRNSPAFFFRRFFFVVLAERVWDWDRPPAADADATEIKSSAAPG